jgi:hypothetical protein
VWKKLMSVSTGYGLARVYRRRQEDVPNSYSIREPFGNVTSRTCALQKVSVSDMGRCNTTHQDIKFITDKLFNFGRTKEKNDVHLRSGRLQFRNNYTMKQQGQSEVTLTFLQHMMAEFS